MMSGDVRTFENPLDGDDDATDGDERRLKVPSQSLADLQFRLATDTTYRGSRQHRNKRPKKRVANEYSTKLTSEYGGLDDKRDGASWLSEQGPGEIYSVERIRPTPPARVDKLRYYWDGLTDNQKNKWMYLEFRGELSFVQEKLSALHSSFFEMDERRELHDAFMQDKEGQELDDAVEQINEGFIRRATEEVAGMYRDIVSSLRCHASRFAWRPHDTYWHRPSRDDRRTPSLGRRAAM
jgi:hypothetical protein